jgi:hypothetical protein
MPDQPSIGARTKPTVDVDGLTFRDLDDDGQLTPYEDWRLPAAERAADLVARMTLEEKAGLMLIDSLNARFGGQMARYGPDYLDNQHMRRFIFRNVVAPAGEEKQGDDDHVFIAGSSVNPGRRLPQRGAGARGGQPARHPRDVQVQRAQPHRPRRPRRHQRGRGSLHRLPQGGGARRGDAG